MQRCGSCNFSQMFTIILTTLIANLLHCSGARTVRRICKDSEIEILSSQGVKIEPVDVSHTELQLAESITASNIRFEFKTESSSGILFYARNRENPVMELIALRLMSGALYYKIQCSTVSADVLLPFSGKLDDGEWHSVSLKFRKGGLKAHVEVDGVKDSKMYEVSCDDMTSLVFGGISPRDKEAVENVLENVPHYDGCIRRVHLQAALRAPPKYYAVSVCE